jgi:hypothetical protein
MRALFITVALGLLWAARKKGSSRPAPDMVTQLILLAFLFLPVLIWGFGFSIRPIFMERTILFAIPGSILAIAVLVNALPGNRMRDGGAVLSVAAIASTLLFHGTMRPREDWRGAYAALSRNVRGGDVVLLCAWQFPSLRHSAVRSLAAPLVFVASATPLMFERRLGERPDWDRIFFRYDILPVTRHSERGPLIETKVYVAARGRLWLVESDCPGESREAINGQFGGLGWERVWASTPTEPARAEVRISHKVAASAISIPALIPPEVLSATASAR